MNYNPGVTPESGRYIMQGLAQGQQAAAMWANLIGYYTGRHNEGERNRALLETISNYPGQDAGGMGAQAPAQGFNPMAPGQEGAPQPPDEDAGPSPAAQRGMQADALRKVIQTYAPEAKDLHTALKGMSVDQLEGIVKGHVMNQSAQEQAAKTQDLISQARERLDVGGYRKALSDRIAAGEAGTERFQNVLQKLVHYGQDNPDGTPNVNGYPTTEQMAMLGISLGVPSEKVGSMVKAVEEARGPQQITVGGRKFVKWHGNLMPLDDNTETPEGFLKVPDGKGGFKFTPTKTALDPEGQKAKELEERVKAYELFLKQRELWQKDVSDAVSTVSNTKQETGFFNKANPEYATAVERLKQVRAKEPNFDDFYNSLKGQKASSKPAAAAKEPVASGPATVTTKAQFDALPSGAIYMDKDGKKYRKP